MRLKKISGMLGAVGATALMLVACGANDSYEYGGGEAYGSSTETVDAGSGITGDGAPSETPMLATIDPNASMMQTPGQGVGVFAQYTSATASDAGVGPADGGTPRGHWYVWWTCDTNLSGEACVFQVKISTTHGVITNAASESFLNSDTLAAGDQVESGKAIIADTLTTTTVQGVRFDTDPGDIVTLAASLGGDFSGSFLFFVQDGKVDGDYKGTLTDPLELEPSSP